MLFCKRLNTNKRNARYFFSKKKEMNKTFLWFLLFFGAFNCNEVIDSLCNATDSGLSIEMQLSHLQEWCVNDMRCSFMFRQRHGSTNSTIFRFLALPILNQEGGNLLSPIKKILCEKESVVDILEGFWPLFLVAAQIDNKPHCGVNKRLELNQEKMIMECLCDAESDCSEPSSNYTFILIMVIFFTVVLVLCCVCQFINSSIYFRIVRNSVENVKKKKMEEAELLL